MGTFVVRLDAEHYVKWSNTVDAPVSPVVSRGRLAEFLGTHDGLTAGRAEDLLRQADETGTSDPGLTLAEVLAENCAGPDEEWLPVEEIIRRYREDDA